jgi:hypothetical protein
MQWGGNSGGYFLLHSSHSMDCVLCVRILVGSVLSFVYSSTGSHYAKQQSASHNFEPFAFRLHLLSIILEIRVFLLSEMYVLEKGMCTAWLMQNEARNLNNDDNSDNETLQPIEHHHQTKRHATIVVSQACLMNSNVSKQHFSLHFTNLLYVSSFL